jgi:hypothetical protein
MLGLDQRDGVYVENNLHWFIDHHCNWRATVHPDGSVEVQAGSPDCSPFEMERWYLMPDGTRYEGAYWR